MANVPFYQVDGVISLALEYGGFADVIHAVFQALRGRGAPCDAMPQEIPPSGRAIVFARTLASELIH
jgi:hypothetical protein